eukprot:4004764-Amphidinium_carterae.1
MEYLLVQQGNLSGHCLRRGDDHLESAVFHWKHSIWSQFNSQLPPYVRSMHHTSGPARTVASWWFSNMAEMVSLHNQVDDRIGWKSKVETVASTM